MKDVKSTWIKFLLCICAFGAGITWIICSLFVKTNVIGLSNSIPIAMALDDGYLYPTLVSMTSMLENMSAETWYDFYIMHPNEFTQESKNKIQSLEKKYERCNINFINMKDEYKNANDKGHITTPAYYRLSLSEILPNLNKIIWLDGDTLIFRDLKEMYDIDMQNYYYKGFLDDNVNAVNNFVKDNDHCICSGVMLINLDELRKDGMVKKFEEFINLNNEKLIQHDQTTINAVAYKKIGILPACYGIYNYWSLDEAKSQVKVYRYSNAYDEQELERAYKDPCVLHCISKPWKNSEVYGCDKWWDYASKTDFYDEINEKYPIF